TFPGETQPESLDMQLLPGWTVSVPAPTFDPDDVALDVYQRIDRSFRIQSPIAPPTYASLGIRFEVNDDQGNLVEQCFYPAGNADSSCEIPRGTEFDIDRQYSARYVLNPASESPLVSASASLPFQRRTIEGV